MASPEQLESIIRKGVEEFNAMRPHLPPVSGDFEAVLFGPGGQIDSLGLVNLIVAVEQQLENDLDVSVTLASERAMSQRNSPFRSLAALRDYTLLILQEPAA